MDNSFANGIGENNDFLNKKRKCEFSEYSDEKSKNKIKIIGINSLKIPTNIKEKFWINATYLNNCDNKTYTRDFESTNKNIPKDYLIKYYECLFFEKSKGQKFTKKIAFP